MHDCGAWTGEAHKHIESSHLTPEFGLTPEFEVVLPQGTMDDNIKVALRAGAPLEAAYAMGSYYPARHGTSRIRWAPLPLAVMPMWCS